MKSNMHSGANKFLFQRAVELRNKATHAEELLWNFLKTKPGGLKFRRQHPYSNYILDFYCHRLKLVIEVDGCIHDNPDVKQNDINRQNVLEADRLKVLRLTNEECLYDMQGVINRLNTLIQNNSY
jgi:imidazole glycerol-phosphate synthase subunit HisF